MSEKEYDFLLGRMYFAGYQMCFMMVIKFF